MVIKSDILELDKTKCCEIALELFMEESGCSKEGEKYDRMRKEAFQVLDVIKSGIDIKAIYSFYDELQFDGPVLTVEGREFRCTAFEQLDSEAIEGAYFYAVSAGDYYLEDKPIMQQLYADIWGTAFTDAIRRMLVDMLKQNHAVSDSFGPGFYGMDVIEMKKMPEMVDFGRLGMEVRDSCVILPLKSCAGILFKVNEKYRRLNSACELCYGSKKTCTLCSIRNHII